MNLSGKNDENAVKTRDFSNLKRLVRITKPRYRLLITAVFLDLTIAILKGASAFLMLVILKGLISKDFTYIEEIKVLNFSFYIKDYIELDLNTFNLKVFFFTFLGGHSVKFFHSRVPVSNIWASGKLGFPLPPFLRK